MIKSDTEEQKSEELKMKIFVKNMKGNHFQIQVQPHHTVSDVKKIIESIQGANVFPASQQMLIYQGKVLTDGTTLEENKVAENSFIVVMLSKSKISSGESSMEAALPTSMAPATSESSSIEASTKPQTTVPNESLPALKPTSVSAPILSSKKSSVSESDASGQAASNFVTENDLENTIQVILNMGRGIWDRETVVRALSAASNNPERAVEYLKSNKSSFGESSSAAAPIPTSKDSAVPESSSVETSTMPITESSASLPESMPNSVQPILSSSLSESDVEDQGSSNLVRNDLDYTTQHILDMGGGIWDRDSVVRALRAASNNPEIAVEYLFSGIPKQAEVASPALSVKARQPVNTSSVSPQPTQPASAPFRRPNPGPLNIVPQFLPSLSSDAAPSGALDFLRNSEQFQALRAMVQSNPQVLQPMLQELGKQNPNVMRLIQEHQTEFHQLLNEPVEGEDGNILEQLAGAMPQAIQVTPGEHAAIERLEAMGFNRSTVLEVYFACNKNEELTANYLIDHMHEL